MIRLGDYKFGVNNQSLDYSIITKDNQLFAHLTGTNFYEAIEDEILTESMDYWEQTLVSENPAVYRSEYLAYQAVKELKIASQDLLDTKGLETIIKRKTRLDE